MVTTKYQICQRCVMDTTDENIIFDKTGNCNHCSDWYRKRNNSQISRLIDKETILNQQIDAIKKAGEGKEYDCIIGISGGVDSTYLVYLAKEVFGLRPLAVHLDNGWNSKLASKNIKNIVKILDIDLHTHVIDWEEFKSLQLAYLKASVLDIEVLTDHAIHAILLQVANEKNVQYFLSGFNPSTEDIIPKSWTFNKNDLVNLMDINSIYGTKEIKTFPTLGEKKYKEYAKNVKSVQIYNYYPFDLQDAMTTIKEKLKWQEYGGKHYESIFTRFYQGYILPNKFKIDKRKAHLSSQICLGVITREEALQILSQPTYDTELMQRDYDYVIKKFDLTKEEFESIMSTPAKSHFQYKTNFRSKIQKKVVVPTNPIARYLKRLLLN